MFVRVSMVNQVAQLHHIPEICSPVTRAGLCSCLLELAGSLDISRHHLSPLDLMEPKGYTAGGKSFIQEVTKRWKRKGVRNLGMERSE